MGPVGVPELLMVVLLAVFWLVPLAAGVWALVTLHRLRAGQDALRSKLDAIERLLQRA